MRALRRSEGSHVRFVVTGADPSFHRALTDLGFGESPEGFWRRFAADAPYLHDAFARFATSLEPMVRQAARLKPVPWEEALTRLIECVDPSVIDWWLAGSTALAVRGIDVRPRDIDVIVPESDFREVVDRLCDYLVEPPSESESWVARWFCRAFMGARVEWIAGVRESPDAAQPSDFGPVAEEQRETVSWRGVPIRVPPLQLQLEVCRRRGLIDRVKGIDDFLSAVG